MPVDGGKDPALSVRQGHLHRMKPGTFQQVTNCPPRRDLAHWPTGGFSGHRSSLGWPFVAPTAAWPGVQSSKTGWPHPQVAHVPPGTQLPPVASAPQGSTAPPRTGLSASMSVVMEHGPSHASPPGHGGHHRGAVAAREALTRWAEAPRHVQGPVCCPGRGSSFPHLTPRTARPCQKQR